MLRFLILTLHCQRRLLPARAFKTPCERRLGPPVRSQSGEAASFQAVVGGGAEVAAGRPTAAWGCSRLIQAWNFTANSHAVIFRGNGNCFPSCLPPSDFAGK